MSTEKLRETFFVTASHPLERKGKHTAGRWEAHIWGRTPRDLLGKLQRATSDTMLSVTAERDGLKAKLDAALKQAEALADALADLRQRFHAACIAHGSDAWAADAACAKSDAALSAWNTYRRGAA